MRLYKIFHKGKICGEGFHAPGFIIRAGFDVVEKNIE